jgi:hypothetical protein
MTLSELGKWRKTVPFFLFGFCILPWFLLRSKSLADAKLSNEIVVPSVATLGAFFYIAFDLRRPLWKREMDAHVNKQIRRSVLEMIPKDLAVTDCEKQDLQGEVVRKLTGVFWEAVERSDILRSQKEHFYSNGIVYSTALDVYLIGAFVGCLYAVASYITRNAAMGYVGASLIAIALMSKHFALPRIRARHLELSIDQLDLLRREQLEFVSGRFREIISGWRRNRLLT